MIGPVWLRRIFQTAVLVLLLLFARPVWSNQANVFVYHRFNDARYPSTNTSVDDFKAQLELLRKEHFTVLRLGEIVKRIKAGDALPERCAAITIDDAYRSFLTAGWPLLQRYAFPVTLFVSTDTIGGGDYLNWQELASLQNEGVEIGNHSASHAYLLDRLPGESDRDWAGRVAADIRRAQQAFAEHLGVKPRLFAYPYGEFDPALSALVKKAGFEAAFGQQSGVITPDQDVFQLPRFPVGGNYTALDEFRSKLFMKHLEVRVIEPKTPVVDGENPPTLKVFLDQDKIDTSSLRCFVAGRQECTIRQAGGGSGFLAIKALKPLTGRRSKYTLTARGVGDGAWYWYSQLWIQPGVAKMADQPVAR